MVPVVQCSKKDIKKHVKATQQFDADGAYIRRCKDAADAMNKARAAQSMEFFPELMHVLKDSYGFDTDWSCKDTEGMSAQLARLANKEWERRRQQDTSLPPLKYQAADMMDHFEGMEGVAFVNYFSVTFPTTALPTVARGLNEATGSTNVAADCCHIKSGDLMGTYYIVVWQDANRNLRLALVQYQADTENRLGWDTCSAELVKSRPYVVHGAELTESGVSIKANSVCKCDGDKGMEGAMDAANIDTFNCSNHFSENLVKHTHDKHQGELCKLCSNACSHSSFGKQYGLLSKQSQSFLEKNKKKEEWSVAFHPTLEAGGCMDDDSTNNAAESINNALDAARRQDTPAAAVLYLMHWESGRYTKIRSEALAETEPWPKRVRDLMAEMQEAADKIPAQNVNFDDGDAKMHGTVLSVSTPGHMHNTSLTRISTGGLEMGDGEHGAGRVDGSCSCGYKKLKGFCKHMLKMAQVGKKVTVPELVPLRYRTTAWKMQYQQERMDLPSMEQVRSIALNAEGGSSKLAKELRAAKGAQPRSQLMSVVAVGRPKGRPSNKDKDRVKSWRHQGSKPKKASVTSLGELVMVNKKKCRKCDQYGHQAGECTDSIAVTTH